MIEEFTNDYYRMTGEHYRFGFRSIIKMLYSHQIRYMKWWRKNNQKSNLLTKLMLYKYCRKYGIEIPAKAKIGRGLEDCTLVTRTI